MTQPTISLTITGDSDAVGQIMDILRGGTPVDTPTTQRLKQEEAVDAPPKPKKESAAAKKKRLAAEAKAAKEAEAAEADDLLDDGNPEVTIDDLKGVVKETIERTSIDDVKAVFKQFKAAKISDLATETYADVKTALEAL